MHMLKSYKGKYFDNKFIRIFLCLFLNYLAVEQL